MCFSRCHFLRFEIALIIMYGVFSGEAFNAEKIVLFILNTYTSTDERILFHIHESRRVNRNHVWLWSVTHSLFRLDRIFIIKSLSAGEFSILSLSRQTMRTFYFPGVCHSSLFSLMVDNAAFAMWPWPFFTKHIRKTRKCPDSQFRNQKLDWSEILESWNSRIFWNHGHSGVWLRTQLWHTTVHIIHLYILRSKCRCRLLIRIQCPFTCGEMVWVALVSFYSSVWLHNANAHCKWYTHAHCTLYRVNRVNVYQPHRLNTNMNMSMSMNRQRAKMKMIVLVKSIVIMIV